MSADREKTLACRIDGYTDLPPGSIANGVTFLEMRRPKLTLLFSAAWRKSGDTSAVERFVEVIAE